MKTGHFTEKDGNWMNQFIKVAVIPFHQMVMNYFHQATGGVLMQLILPMCDTKNSGVHNNPQKSYSPKVEVWSAIYGYQIGLGGPYGHAIKPAKIKEHTMAAGN
eukprot:6127482-Ditylum_brightwellii.AAC.3